MKDGIIKTYEAEEAVTMRSENAELRAEIARDVEAFFAAGGKIQKFGDTKPVVTDDFTRRLTRKEKIARIKKKQNAAFRDREVK